MFQLRDLFQFMAILAVFIVSFGIAFQAVISPNQPPSWNVVADVLWRPYWQMYGELFLEDGMGTSFDFTLQYAVYNLDPTFLFLIRLTEPRPLENLFL